MIVYRIFIKSNEKIIFVFVINIYHEVEATKIKLTAYILRSIKFYSLYNRKLNLLFF